MTPVLLAPMAGITDRPFRALALEMGASRVVSEMIVAEEMLAASRSARQRCDLGTDDARTIVQIAGRDPARLAEAARRAAGQGAAAIDINLGCPAKKVTTGLAGSALMRDPDHALRLIEAVVAASCVPVSVKMRLGWDSATLTAPEIAARAQEAGVAMITVHARTRCQFYTGAADWAALAPVRTALSIPLIVNGDIADVRTARRAMALSGADGVMIGRAARGRPWRAGQIAAALAGAAPPPDPAPAEVVDIALCHHAALLEFYGTQTGLRVARKHLGWYLAALPGGVEIRARIVRMDSPRAVVETLARFRDTLADKHRPAA